jgi:DNA topoisomerase II
MVLFDEKERLRKYDTVDEIIDKFCRVRYEFYTKRKVHQINVSEKYINHLRNKIKFLDAVVNKNLDIMNIKENEMISKMEEMKLEKEDDSYEYLLRLQVRTFTNEKLSALRVEIKNNEDKLSILKDTTEKKMWINELEEFEKHYSKFLKVTK